MHHEEISSSETPVSVIVTENASENNSFCYYFIDTCFILIEIITNREQLFIHELQNTNLESIRNSIIEVCSKCE